MVRRLDLFNYSEHITDGSIPHTDGYSVSVDGVVKDSKGNIVPTYPGNNGELYTAIKLPPKDGLQIMMSLRVAVLVYVVYKQSKVPQHHWDSLKFFYKDDDFNNVHAGNIAPKRFPDQVSEIIDGKLYKYIPHFTNYGISEDGVIIRFKDHRIMSCNRNTRGYFGSDLAYDLEQGRGNYRTRSLGIRRHRIMGYCFLDYPKNVIELDINHRNGVPGDDWLDNLEWATRGENVLHAINEGLHSRAKSIYALDIITGKIEEFPSTLRVRTTYGVAVNTAVRHLKTNKVSELCQPHHFYSYDKDELAKYVDYKVTDKDIIRIGKLKVANSQTGDVIHTLNFIRDLIHKGITTLNKTALYRRFYSSAGEKVIEGFKMYYQLGKYIFNGQEVIEEK